jgi:uncharacterized RDD family membrane protein YckC
MSKGERDTRLGEGVYYAREDCAGLGRRLVITVVDLLVVVVGASFLWYWVCRSWPRADPLATSLAVWLGVAFLYLAVLKPSPIRTIGYVLLGARIVTLRGQRPSVLRMAFRLLLWGIGPFALPYDLIWIGVDDNRQSFRDRFVGTYVIRRRAQPIGRGEIHLTYYFALGYALMFPQVQRSSGG